jgi:hypothetical protein
MVNKLAVALRIRSLAGEGVLQNTGAPYPPGVTIREMTRACVHKNVPGSATPTRPMAALPRPPRWW